MKKRTSFKYINIYTFIIVLTLVGFISGMKYYDYQKEEYKTELKESIDLQKAIENTPFIGHHVKNSFFIFLNSFLIVTHLFTVYELFYEPFSIGFIFGFLKSINSTIAFPYVLVYKLIPLLFGLIEIRVAFTISKNIIIFLLNRGNKVYRNHIKTLLKKYLLITSFKGIYLLILFIIHAPLTSYFISKL